jgi:hypothetical protein
MMEIWLCRSCSGFIAVMEAGYIEADRKDARRMPAQEVVRTMESVCGDNDGESG